MGILREPADFVLKLKLPQGFSVCELGDQWMSGRKEPMLAADWYKSIGCGHYVSIDGNGKATVTADLNQPLNIGANAYELVDGFDLVTDFGTGEHIFNQAEVWRTLHDMCNPGGYIVFDRPAEGYPGHCYYRIDRCLIDDIARANRYDVIRVEVGKTPRGKLIRGVFRKTCDAPFVIPQQGRYLDSLVIA